MSVQQEIEHFIVQEFAVLQSKYGFQPPTFKRQGWITSIDLANDGIAIEVEVDWREFDVFLLVVRLEAGQLPRGYYVSNGKRCRIHLLTLIEERHWPVDQGLISRVRRQVGADTRERRVEDLMNRIVDYRAILLSCLDKILAEKEGIFSE